MAGTTGLSAVRTYTAIDVTTTQLAKVQGLLDELLTVIPNPETAPAQGTANNLDQMHPSAALQLRVEIAAARAAVSGT